MTSHAFLRQVSKEKETNISDGGRGQPNKGGAKQKKGKGGRRGGKERVEEGAGPGQWEVKFMSNDEVSVRVEERGVVTYMPDIFHGLFIDTTVYVEIFSKFLFSRVSKIAKFKTLVILSILKIYTVVTFAHAYRSTIATFFTNRWSPDILIDMVSSNTSGKRKLLTVSHVHIYNVLTQYSV